MGFRFHKALMVATGWAATALAGQTTSTQPSGPVRLGIAGLVHGHVYMFLQDAARRADVTIAGLYDPAPELLNRYGKHHHKFPDSALFADLDNMLDSARPEAVAVFTDTADHLRVIQACARRGIPVMVEKPLAINLKQAREIEALARRAGTHILVNYETSYYPNTAAALALVADQNRLGPVRRMVFNTGHRGPKELGMPREFVSWLTDPARGGGGAMTDFGCYGVNLATCLMNCQRPKAVTAVTARYKTDPAYAGVEDESTIVLAYADAQAVIQASWNWPFDRKDMEIYGDNGSFRTLGRDHYAMRLLQEEEKTRPGPPLPATMADPIAYLAAVARGRCTPTGPASLKVNLVVEEILDAARRSAQAGRTIRLDEN